MRNTISNPRTIRRLEKETGLKIEWAQTRGGTDHRIDLYCADGFGYDYYPGKPPTRNGARKTEGREWRSAIPIPPPLPVADVTEIAATCEADLDQVFETIKTA